MYLSFCGQKRNSQLHTCMIPNHFTTHPSFVQGIQKVWDESITDQPTRFYFLGKKLLLQSNINLPLNVSNIHIFSLNHTCMHTHTNPPPPPYTNTRANTHTQKSTQIHMGTITHKHLQNVHLYSLYTCAHTCSQPCGCFGVPTRSLSHACWLCPLVGGDWWWPWWGRSFGWPHLHRT